MSLLLSLILLWTGAGFAAVEPSEGTPSAPPVKGADLQLLEDVRVLAGRLQDLRGVEFERAPIAVRASQEDREAVARYRVESAVDQAALEARGRAWEDVGLARPGSPARLFRTLARDLDGVSAEPEAGRLLVDPARLTDSDFSAEGDGDDEGTSLLMATGVRPDEPPIVHVLMHLLQGERFGWKGLPGTTDALLARAAWAEGEANVAALRYLFRPMGLQDEILARGLEPESVLGGTLHPTGLDPLSGPEATLAQWVYRDGFAQAASRFQAGGWEALEDSLRNRRTTRDVMHLDRKPLKLEVMSEPVPDLPDGFRIVDRDVLGEQSIVVMVSYWTGKDNLGLLAGDGWAGDDLFRYEREDGARGVTLWVTRWETEQAAIDFVYAYTRAMEARFQGQPPVTDGEGRSRFDSAERVVRLERAGRQVRVDVRPPSLAPKSEKSLQRVDPPSGISGD